MHELLTPDEMARADKLTIEAGTPGIVLMERAGRAVADAVAFAHALGSRVLVVAGPGNNGGDGYVAARILVERGYKVELWSLVPAEKLNGDAALAAARYKGVVLGEGFDTFAAGLTRASVVIDALFGAGLARDLDGLAGAVVMALNASGKPVVAVDLPSGIDGLTGAVRGVAVQATASVTFFRKKPGHLLLPGRAHAGPVIVADIGIRARVIDELGIRTFSNAPRLWLDTLEPPQLQGHKYARGHALVISGGMTTTGAARLAAIAALRSGSGLVTVLSPPDALMVHAMHLTAVMLKKCGSAEDLTGILQDARLNAILLGPGAGVGPTTAAMVGVALTGKRAVVLDADALTSFQDRPEDLFAGIHGHEGAVVLTPHEGEFARLFPDLAERSGKPKLDRARVAANRSGATIILKGADTVIAAPDGRAVINDNAPPDLATAGSGDTLAGIVVGLLARGLPGFEAACAAVWMHGETGKRAGAGLIAEDLAGHLPAVLTDLYRQRARAAMRDPMAGGAGAGVSGEAHANDDDVVIGGSD